MKRLLIGTSIVAMMTGTAFAADLIEPAPAPYVPPAPVYTWTGFYAGIQAGYGSGDSNYDFAFDYPPDPFASLTPAVGEFDLGVEGFIGGGHVGYLHQFNWFVVGVEGDVEYNGLDDSAQQGFSAIDVFGFPFTSSVASAATDYNFSASARGRLGVVLAQRTMLYATGGYAYANVDLDFDGIAFSPAGPVIGEYRADEGNLHGWTAGAGVEGLLTPDISVRVEYRYTQFEDIEVDLANDIGPGVGDLEIENNFHAIRGGISYHF